MSRRDDEAYRQPAVQRSKFSKEEDSKLLEAVETHGASDWDLIAKSLQGRNARQCRERWSNYVNPEITSDPFSKDEDELLNEVMASVGPHWKIVSSYFPKRSINNIKNRWMSLKKKKDRDQRKLLFPENRLSTPTQIEIDLFKDITEPQPDTESNQQLKFVIGKQDNEGHNVKSNDSDELAKRELNFNLMEYLDSVFNETELVGSLF